MSQLLTALRHIHQKHICHRDVSLENILLTAAKTGSNVTQNIVLVDFGLGASFDEASASVRGVCGKGFYISPEVKACGSDFVRYDGRKADAWSAGVCLFMMLFGVPPVETPCRSDSRFRQIAAGKMREMLHSWGVLNNGNAVPEGALQLLERLLVVDPKARATVQDALAMPWLRAEEDERQFQEKLKKAQAITAAVTASKAASKTAATASAIGAMGPEDAVRMLATSTWKAVVASASQALRAHTIKISHGCVSAPILLSSSAPHSAPAR
jgi:serine/threonine protein kinase